VPQEVSASNNNDDSKSDLEGAETFYVNKIWAITKRLYGNFFIFDVNFSVLGHENFVDFSHCYTIKLI
jgi:hypothetical protein